MKHSYRILVFIIALVAPLLYAKSAQAQVLKMQLANPEIDLVVGQATTVNILINTNNVDTIAADALIIFDPAKIKINEGSGISGGFFTYFDPNKGSLLTGFNNKFLISAWEESIAYAKKSSTDVQFASFTITPQSSGQTTLTFDCTAGTGADSNINRASDSSDVINCASLASLNLTISGSSSSGSSPTPASSVTGGVSPTTGASGGATLTPTKTATPSATRVPPTSTPSKVPTPTKIPGGIGGPNGGTVKPTLIGAGSLDVTIAAVGVGTLLTVVGVLLIL